MIASNVTAQFSAGWDWMQPVRDRNAGIWDSVHLSFTGLATLQDVHVIASESAPHVPLQEAAALQVSTRKLLWWVR